MASLRDIRKRISSVKSTQQVTRAMKMVAAAKLRKAQERTFEMRAYAYKLGEIISHLKQHIDPSAHELFKPREEIKNVLLIIVTADRGLAGAFNANIIKLAEQTIKERYEAYHAAGHLHLICIGRKSHEYFRRRNHKLVGDFRGVFNDLDFEDASQIVNAAVQGYREGRWDEVQVIYNEFKNTISQNRIVEPLLPIPPDQFRTPVMERVVERVAKKKEGQSVDFIFEPDPIAILNVLVPRFLHFTIWRALLESNAAEQGARMVAMDNATSNAEDLMRDLRLKYNRARQDAITKELIEITSGADALAKA
jgi:F-type H+-transporting ATPase subunit gamma